MASGALTYTVSVDPGDDGGSRSITGTVTLDVSSASEGTYSVGNTYDNVWGPSMTGFQAVVIYNTGLVDLSMRVTTPGTPTYHFYCIPPGAVFVVPEKHLNATSTYSAPTTIGLRSESGTGTFDYCVIR